MDTVTQQTRPSAELAERERAVTTRDCIIEMLKGHLAALRRRTFGQSSEKLGRVADQLELQITEWSSIRRSTPPHPFQ